MTDKKLNLKTARLIAGYTQGKLALLIGVHPQTIADWEKNPEKVPISTAKKITEVLGTDFDIFFN